MNLTCINSDIDLKIETIKLVISDIMTIYGNMLNTTETTLHVELYKHKGNVLGIQFHKDELYLYMQRSEETKWMQTEHIIGVQAYFLLFGNHCSMSTLKTSYNVKNDGELEKAMRLIVRHGPISKGKWLLEGVN